jgi:hypothetical protein
MRLLDDPHRVLIQQTTKRTQFHRGAGQNFTQRSKCDGILVLHWPRARSIAKTAAKCPLRNVADSVVGDDAEPGWDNPC